MRIDHPDFKRMEDSLNARSKLSDPNPVNREEWGFFGRRDPTAPNGIKFDPPSAWFTDNNPCTVTIPVPTDPNIVVVIHSHPSYKNENVTFACNDPNLLPYNPNSNGGGSVADWTYARLFLPVYAVSPQEIHELTGNVSVNDQSKNRLRWRKQKSGCWAYKP